MRALAFSAGVLSLACCTPVAPKSAVIRVLPAPEGQCRLLVQGQTIDASNKPALRDALKSITRDRREVHLIGDRDTSYRCVGAAVYTLQAAGVDKVGFISQPPSD